MGFTSFKPVSRPYFGHANRPGKLGGCQHAEHGSTPYNYHANTHGQQSWRKHQICISEIIQGNFKTIPKQHMTHSLIQTRHKPFMINKLCKIWNRQKTMYSFLKPTATCIHSVLARLLGWLICRPLPCSRWDQSAFETPMHQLSCVRHVTRIEALLKCIRTFKYIALQTVRHPQLSSGRTCPKGCDGHCNTGGQSTMFMFGFGMSARHIVYVRNQT